MKALASISIGVLCAFATPSFATSPLRPIFPIRPIRPVPVFPVVPVLPVQPIQPVLPGGDSVEVGLIPYVGYGFRTEVVEMESRFVNHVRLRIPNQCALQVNPVAFHNERGTVRSSLVTMYNDGLYTHAIYSVNGNRGAELNEIELGLNSMFAYGPEHQCGVRVFVSSNYAIPYNQ